MTKSEVEGLKKRVTKLDGKTSAGDGDGGRTAWLIHHLTEDEEVELARCIKRVKTNEEDKEAEEQGRGLLEKARIRGEARPVSLKEEFYRKHSRLEELRNVGRPMTDAEHEELVALNDWFEKLRQEPRTFEEQLEAGVKELEENPEFAKAEGLECT